MPLPEAAVDCSDGVEDAIVRGGKGRRACEPETWWDASVVRLLEAKMVAMDVHWLYMLRIHDASKAYTRKQ